MSANRKARTKPIEAVPVVSKVAQNVDAIGAMVEREELAINRYQRGIEKLVFVISCPTFLALSISSITVWICGNVVLKQSGRHALDPPPFSYLQGAMSIAAFLLATVILITQYRQSQIAHRRAHLDLQLNMLVEQKVAKVIQLIEEMRKDSPQLKNRIDLEAEEMQGSTDPEIVAASLETRFSTSEDKSTQ